MEPLNNTHNSCSTGWNLVFETSSSAQISPVGHSSCGVEGRRGDCSPGSASIFEVEVDSRNLGIQDRALLSLSIVELVE